MRRLYLILTIAIMFFGASNALSQTTGVDLGFGEEDGEKVVQERLNKSLRNLSLVYFDFDYEPATASDHFYRRVLKRLEPANCSLIDYYENGEPALVASIFTYYSNCSHGYLQGPVVFYYRNGQKSSIKPYNEGTWIQL